MGTPPSALPPDSLEDLLKDAPNDAHQIVQNAHCAIVDARFRFENTSVGYTGKDANGPCRGAEKLPGKPRLYRAASLVKLFISLAFCRILVDLAEEERFKNLSFGKSAFGTYYGDPNLTYGDQGWMPLNPSILDLLLHRKGFAKMNRSLLSPNGIFMLSTAEEFIKMAIALSFHSSSPDFVYSSANYMFAALILEKITGEMFDVILEKYVFKPLGLNATTTDPVLLQEWIKSDKVVIAEDYRLSGQSQSGNYQEKLTRYMTNTPEKAFLGAWTNADDIDNMFDQLYQALDGKNEGKPEIFSQNAAKRFFEIDPLRSDIGPQSLAATKVKMTSDQDAPESPNQVVIGRSSPIYVLSEREEKRGSVLGRLKKMVRRKRKSSPSGHASLFYKGACMTDYTGTVYFDPDERISVVVLAHTSSLIDPTPYIAHVFLQPVLDLYPPTDIPKMFEEKAPALIKASTLLKHKDNNLSGWDTRNISRFVGRYEDRTTGICMIVTDQAEIVFKKGDRQSETMPVLCSGDMLRIVPRPEQWILDRLVAWRDMQYRLENLRCETTLIGDEGKEHYFKQV